MTQRTRFGRRIALCLAVGVASLALPQSASATPTTYYVSPTGSDAGAGTIADPFRTIGKGADAARRGDTVLVAPGRYAETVTLGSSSSGVTFNKAGNTLPVLDGGGVRQYGFKNDGANDAIIENFEITGQTDAGIYSRGTNDTLADNVIHHIGSPSVAQSNGIRVVQRADDRVIDNTIYSIGPGGESMGIWLLQTRDALVDGNEVYLVRKEGIRDWEGLDNTITRNRLFLNWVGIAFNTSTGSTATNNYLYDNVEGFNAKHTSYPTVLSLWDLAGPHWSRFWHNTVYDSTETSAWIAQSDQPLDYLDVEDNIFDDAGTALVRDAPGIRGPHVIVDGNAYVYPGAAGRPAWVYKAGWLSDPGVSDWRTYRSQLGWEAHGIVVPSLPLLDPASGDLDYSDDSPAAAGSVDLSDSLGRQLGARGLRPATVRWTSYPMTPIDSSSKGTWSTDQHLADTVDNNQNSYWMTSTASNEYVTYDFGQPRTFDHLILTLFSHLDPRNPHGYRFEVSDDLVNWRTVLSGDNPDSEGSSYKYELPAPVTARYLRFTMVDTSCDSYSPRTNCGAYFVLSDLSAGLLTSADDPPPSSDPGSSSGADPSKPAPKAPRAPLRPVTPLPTAKVASARLTRGGRLELSLRCPADPAGRHCRSTALVRLPRSRHTAARVIARRAFNVPAGRRQVLKLRLTRTSIRQLRSRRAKNLRVTIRLSGKSSVSRLVHLRQARQRRRSRHP